MNQQRLPPDAPEQLSHLLELRVMFQEAMEHEGSPVLLERFTNLLLEVETRINELRTTLHTDHFRA